MNDSILYLRSCLAICTHRPLVHIGKEKRREERSRDEPEVFVSSTLIELGHISLFLSVAPTPSPSALTRYDRWMLALLEIVAQRIS